MSPWPWDIEEEVVAELNRWAFFWVRMFCYGVLFGFLTACARPERKHPVLPTLPPLGDVERLIPPPPAPVEIPANAPRFADRAVTATECPGQPEGILTSRAAYAERISIMAQGQRCAAEAKALRQLRQEEHAAAAALEAAYRNRVSELEREVIHERKMGRWRMWLGAAGGAIVMLAATWAAGKAR
jgi:hypothetical protein